MSIELAPIVANVMDAYGYSGDDAILRSRTIVL
jgi:hypothetical protein